MALEEDFFLVKCERKLMGIQSDLLNTSRNIGKLPGEFFGRHLVIDSVVELTRSQYG